MGRHPRTLVGLVLTVGALGLGAVAAPGRAADPPVHDVAVTGAGVVTYPAYDPAVGRYGIRTTAATGGTVTVRAATSDPGGRVTVNGRPVGPSGTTLSGLRTGDEVNVGIVDAGGRSSQSFVYLPDGFPAMSATRAGPGPAPGRVFLTLSSFGGGPRFEAVVDRNGVPVRVRRTLNPMDLKRQPNGHYSVARGRSDALDSSFDIVELDRRFREVARHTTRGLGTTDFHDSVLLPGGGRILMAYVPDPATGRVDSVVQEIGAGGRVALTWNSRDHVDPAVDGLTTLADYAHLNSIDVTDDGNLLLSFRHLSQVMKVDRRTGAVLWRLGGVRSDFTFPDDPYGGPCAQHTARELANGDIQVWDNGSEVTSTTLEPLCPDPADPTGPRVERAFSRVTRYRLDPATRTAHLVSQVLPGEFSEFAGSAQRLGSTARAHTLIGTAGGRLPGGADAPDVLEVNSAGTVVWALDVRDYFSYRALKFPAPDAIPPTVDVGLASGALLVAGSAVRADYGCADRGGSNLRRCVGDVPSGALLDTSQGRHSLTVTATDGAGNATTRTVHYRAVPRSRPDAAVRQRGGHWVGVGTYAGAAGQQVRLVLPRDGARRVAEVRVTNTGAEADGFRLRARPGTAAWHVRYRHGSQDVTDALVGGTLRTPELAPGDAYRIVVVVQRGARADDGDRLTLRLAATSLRDGRRRDAVEVALRGR